VVSRRAGSGSGNVMTFHLDQNYAVVLVCSSWKGKIMEVGNEFALVTVNVIMFSVIGLP